MRRKNLLTRTALGALSGALSLGLVSCAQTVTRPPPADRFYFPTGIAHVDVPGRTEGTLYVASANADRCYETGSIRALSLDALPQPLPPLGAPVPASGPAVIEDLGNPDPQSQRSIETFAGQLATWPLPSGGHRLVIPTRAEGSLLQIVDATGPAGTTLTCVPASADGAAPENCAEDALSLDAVPEGSESSDVPRAPAPIGVAIAPDGQTFITHIEMADDPWGSRTNERGYVVRMNAADPKLVAADFLQIPRGGTQSVAIGQRYAFVSARELGRGLDAVIAVPRDPEDKVLHAFPLQLQYAVTALRGIALSEDERTLYVVGRSVDDILLGGNPDVLLVASVAGPRSAAPVVRVTRVVPLPTAPAAIQRISRAGGSDLVLIVAQGSGSLAIYDEGIGQLVAEVKGLGVQPSQLAVDLRAGTVDGNSVEQARVYVSNFGDGRVAVVDLPDLARPEDARVVAYLGRRQDDVQSQHSNTCRIGDE